MGRLHELDDASVSLVRAYGVADTLSAVIRAEANDVRIICPVGLEGELALMLYRAGDVLAERATTSPSLKH